MKIARVPSPPRDPRNVEVARAAAAAVARAAAVAVARAAAAVAKVPAKFNPHETSTATWEFILENTALSLTSVVQSTACLSAPSLA